MTSQIDELRRLANEMGTGHDLWDWLNVSGNSERLGSALRSAADRVERLEGALRALIKEAIGMDLQIEGEWSLSTDEGYGKEDPAITAAREVLGDPPLDWRPPLPPQES